LSFLSVPAFAAGFFAGTFFPAIFFAAICLILQNHWFAAADQFSAAGLFYHYNVTTDLALEDLPFF
jgi:hypothetical protein